MRAEGPLATNGQLAYVIILSLASLVASGYNLVTRMVGTTSLVVLIGVVEVTQSWSADYRPLTIPALLSAYGTIFDSLLPFVTSKYPKLSILKIVGGIKMTEKAFLQIKFEKVLWGQ